MSADASVRIAWLSPADARQLGAEILAAGEAGCVVQLAVTGDGLRMLVDDSGVVGGRGGRWQPGVGVSTLHFSLWPPG